MGMEHAQSNSNIAMSDNWKQLILDTNRAARTYDVDIGPLVSVGGRPSLHDYITGLWQRRHFIARQSRAKSFGSARDTVLGRIWLVLSPFLNAAIYFFIFAVLLEFNRGIDNFVAYLVVGVTLFQYLNEQLGSGATIISSNSNMIRAFSFPRASLVFSFSLRNAIDFLPTMFAMLVFIVVMPPHAYPTVYWLLFPVLGILTFVFGVGISFLAATLTSLFRDFRFVWPLVTRAWFYGSGVFWSVDMFAHKPMLQDLMMKNPGWVFLELSRETLIYESAGSWGLWLYYAGWAFGTFFLGFFIFWLNEEKFAMQNAK